MLDGPVLLSLLALILYGSELRVVEVSLLFYLLDVLQEHLVVK